MLNMIKIHSPPLISLTEQGIYLPMYVSDKFSENVPENLLLMAGILNWILDL